MNEKLMQAFHDAHARLQAGESLEAILRAYPEFAAELRDLLTITKAVQAVRADNTELVAMRSRLDKQFDELLAKQPSKVPSRFAPRLLALAATFALVFIGLMLFLPRENEPAIEITLTQGFLESETLQAETLTPSPSPTATVTTTPSPNKTPEPQDSEAADTCAPPRDWFAYRLKAGDTLSQIALDSGISLDELVRANCIEDLRGLLIGQLIYVPHLWEDESEGENQAEAVDTQAANSNNQQGNNAQEEDDNNDADEADEADEDEDTPDDD